MLVGNIKFRWMQGFDVPDVLAVAAEANFEVPLTEARVRRFLRWDDVPRIGLVAECRDRRHPWEHQILGFALYTVRPGKTVLHRLAVRPDARRGAVGLRLLSDLMVRVQYRHYTDRLVAWVPETALPAQLFARACGLRATALRPGTGGAAGHIRFEGLTDRPATAPTSPAERPALR